MIPPFLLLIPFIVQAIAIQVDEFGFHIKRGLPKWERIGHPLDTLSVLLCFLYIVFIPFSTAALTLFLILAVFSCILVTKDEFVHKECCPAKEQWLHALLFINHPIMLLSAGLLWPVISEYSPLSSYFSLLQTRAHFFKTFLFIQTGFVCTFMVYQIIYWNFVWKEKKAS